MTHCHLDRRHLLVKICCVSLLYMCFLKFEKKKKNEIFWNWFLFAVDEFLVYYECVAGALVNIRIVNYFYRPIFFSFSFSSSLFVEMRIMWFLLRNWNIDFVVARRLRFNNNKKKKKKKNKCRAEHRPHDKCSWYCCFPIYIPLSIRIYHLIKM